jgi:hypothetical protein
MGPIHYRISWETRGLLPRDPSGDHTKEVIGGGLGTSKAVGSYLNSGAAMAAMAISMLFHGGPNLLICSQ